MKHKTFMRPFSQMLLMAALLVPAWQVMNAGDVHNPGAYSPSVVAPWKYIGVHYDDFYAHHYDYKRWEHNNQWPEMWETNYSVDGSNQTFGYKMSRGSSRSDHTTNFKVRYEMGDTVPPYAVLELRWGYQINAEGDRGKSAAHIYLFDETINVDSMDLYAYPGALASDSNITNHEYVLCAWQEDRGDYTDKKLSWQYSGVELLKYDNHNFNMPYVPHWTMIHMASMYAGTAMGHVQSTLRTESFTRTVYYPRFNGTGTKESPLQISTSADLKAFADIVNSGVKGTDHLYAVLTGDLDYTPYTDASAMIGTKAHPFGGVLDGQGHTVMVNINDTTEEYAGLFAYVGEATIKNIELRGSIKGLRMIGGVVGKASGNTCLEKVRSLVTLNATSATTGLAGLCAGMGEDNQTHTFTITNCAFLGSIAGDYSKATFNGLCFIRGKATATITNSYLALQEGGTNISGENFGAIKTGSGATLTIDNCYYTRCVASSTQGTQVTGKQMQSGEVCWRLNEMKNESNIWLQTLGTDTLPTLWGAKHVYEQNGVYFNFQPSFRGAGTELDPFQIENISQWERFRDIINAGYNTLCAKLVAEIDLANRNWTPIGRKTSDIDVAYKGVFDGNGYIIHNLNINTGVDFYSGLFGKTDGATIKNVLLHNVTIHNSLGNHIGAVVGRSANTTFLNCASYGTLHFTGDGASRNGITRAAENVTITSCYTSDSVLTTSPATIAYSYYGQDVETGHATGALTYNLNNSAPTPWVQTLGRDDYPLLRGAMNVYKDNVGQYYNDTYDIESSAGYIQTTSGKDFRVIHHGGHLYEFVITMGTQDGNGVYVCPDVTVSYEMDNTPVTILQLGDVNQDKRDFTQDWWGTIRVLQGTYYDSRTYHKQTPTFWIRQGNHTTRKQTSILWLAPEDMTTFPNSFRMKDENNGKLNILSYTESSSVPSDDAGLMLVNPVINTDNTEAGTAKVILTATNGAYSTAIWDVTEDRFISMQELTDGEQTLEINLPQQERVHHLVLLTYARMVEYGTTNDTTYCNYGIPFVQQPCHSILRTNIREDYNADNVLEWAIAFPKDSDILDTDQFTLQRATKANYSDATTIASLGVRNILTTTTENDTLLGWFSETDEDAYRTTALPTTDTLTAFDTWNIPSSAKAALSVYQYPARYLYYQVYRMMVSAVWKKHDAYRRQWKMLQTTLLPTVDSVRVIEDADFDTNHKVTVRVVMNNPYPWEVVSTADRDAVWEEAIQQRFTHRMFMWDSNASIRLYRFSHEDEYDQGNDVIQKTITISGDQIKQDPNTGAYYVEYQDVVSMPFVHYHYKAKVNAENSDYPICESRNTYKFSTEAPYTEDYGGIYNLKATRGTVRGSVEITWEADETNNTTLELRRREYERGYESEKALAGWSTMDAADGAANDDKANAAVVNEYILSITTKYRDLVFTDADTTYGYASYYGTLDGRVKMSNGVNMPGDVHVAVNCNDTFALHEVKSPKGEVIMPACEFQSIKKVLTTDMNGNYQLDSVPYYGSGRIYTVYATCGEATFVSPTGSASTIDLTYEDANYEYTGIDFTCNDTKHFSGRILYTNSTVPVRDVYFKVNGTLLRNAKGEPVITDAMGNFSFNVPCMNVTIQAFRPGHKLSNDGYILGGEDGQQKTFTPTHDYDGLIIDDDTKVRLVGRVAGGVIQGVKPLGFGLGHNNLGDSITLVLQLEGDKTSYLYFDKQNPDDLSYSTTYTQRVVSEGSIEQRIPTHATFEAKRIVVVAHNETGEFCLDLFPTKYVVSQIYANGYSTLYSEGEGQMVLDLTDSVGLHTHLADHSLTEYDASLRRIYHAPVQIDLKQMTNNQFQDLYGEMKSEVEMLTGKQTMQLAWRDTADEVQYAFDHPVYKSNKPYLYQVQAYEPYYYNNIPTGSYERVPMAGYEVSISNGLSRISDSEDEEDEEDELVLNEAGIALFTIAPNNTTFSLTEEEALRHLSVSVDINGYHYESAPIAGYVTGEKDFGTDVITDALEGDIQILDYIRDPYGADSYAWRTKGTTYNWARHYSKLYRENCYFSFRGGVALLLSYGAAFATATEYDLAFTFDLDATTKHEIDYKDGEFTLELSEQISTSDDPIDQGAIADIYLGSVSTVDVVRYQGFNVIDSTSYATILPFVESGDARLVREGRNEDGTPYYLVICGGVTWRPGEERVFAYSQRHILNTLIPNLEARRAEALRIAPDETQARALADASGHLIYVQQGDKLCMVPPAGTVAVADTVALIDKHIEEWKNIIATNERIKLEAMQGTPDKKYSVAGTSIEHSEEASTYYRVSKVGGPLPVNISGGFTEDHNSTSTDSTEKGTPDFKGAGLILGIDLGGGHEYELSDEWENYHAVTGGSGYYISAHDNSYFDMDVYYQNDTSIIYVNQNFMDTINLYESGKGVDDYKVMSDGLQMTEGNAYVHNYVFVMRGGATREPWKDADSTICYLDDNGNRQPLGARTLKIDNPKIYVENPVIYNLPQDEKAVFTVHISNETELTGNVQGIISSVFLHVTDDSNPYGAKISVDGVPLHNYMEFFVNPGETITKTIEVERGGKPYDYEDIVLEVSDEEYRQWDDATISVHYLPTSTPVTLSQPAQNFLINTLSQQDEDGKYYIPVQIEGFSTTKYDNFDHIELQYKRQTDGEDQWVNLCSYYTNELLYKVATGTKAMIETEGKISDIRFYGEQDPVEQKYDLRAVSFCRLGNGYTTRMSSVISGTKDTRCPEVFGLPKPEDGILSFDDVISLPFTEPIAYNYLDETANFTVQGFTNNSDVDNSVALYFSGSDEQQAVSEVDRVLNAMDFSVEMNVKVDREDPDSMVFIAINDDFSEQAKNTFMFGYNHKRGTLITAMNGQLIRSVPLSTYGLTLSSAMTHVGMTYSIQDSTVRFYVGEQEVDVAKEFKGLKLECHANGVVNLGTRFYGKMNNIRLWSKALNLYEMTSKYKKQLSKNEANLLAYWPADEASGTSVMDKANGATLTLTDVSWSLPDGYSVSLDHQTMHILSDQALKYTRNKKEDYTISFYFKVDALDDDANLFAAGSDALAETGKDKVRIRFIDGVLYFVSEGQSVAFGEDNTYASDATWHYLAVCVNHAQNKASLFIDGALVNQLDADRVGGVAGSEIVYGDDAMAAHIDQVQMWSMALPASYIKSYYNAGLTGKEKELQIYLPFEEEAMNSQGTMYTTFSPMNQVIIASTGEIAGDTVVDETLLTADNKVISPVRSATGIENLPFTWKSTNNELQITINKANSEINNQQLSLVVRRVEDLNGNPMQNAQMWTTYVSRNVLSWMIDPRTVIVPYGHDTTIVAGFKNTSGRSLNYTIDCTSPYITLGLTMGTIAPLSNMATTISVSDGLAPGVYQAIINLTDEDGLCSALPIYIRVVATAPDWQATTDPSYNQSMNVIAEVHKQEQGKWVVDMCQKDKVAAFIGKECVGVANLSVDAEANTSYLYLTVRGKTEVAGEAVEFRLWSALTGETYILEATPKVTFAAQSIIGVDQPVDLRAYEMRVQTLSLNPGWNWVSLYVDPFAEKGLNNLFSNQKQLTISDVFRTPFGTTFASFQSNGLWENTLDNMALLKNNVYQIYAQHAANVEVSGSLYADPTIMLDFTQSEWAQMAYLSEQSMPVRQVLGDFVPGTAKAPAGTIIKGYEDFAIATADGTWRGSLEYLRPGEGYFVRRNGLRDSLTITFTNTSASSPSRHLALSPSSPTDSPIHRFTDSPTMMPLVATWSDFQEGDMLLAMVGKEVVAVSEATDALFFVSLHANQGEQIQFAKVRHGEVVAVTSRGLKYDAQGQAGTVEQPYLIDFTETEPDAPIYDILGMKYENLHSLGTRVMIQGTKKVLNK